MNARDAIVIGSGAGGLAAGLALARAGVRVTVYEQHSLPGGYSQSFERRGFRFSPGVHYIGQLGEGGALRTIYEGLGVADELVFLEIDPDGYDRVFVGDERFDIPAGRERFEERLKARFPAETEGIAHYFETITRISDELAWASPPETLRDATLLPLRMRTVLRHGLRPLAHFLDDCTRDPLLRAILSIQSGDHGMAPSRAPTALHAGLQTYYIDGACYPRGGAHVIPEAFVRGIEEEGGELLFETKVARVRVEKGRAVGVRLADGREHRADIVVADVDPATLWSDLVDASHTSVSLRRRVQRLRWSVSTLSLFLAVDMDLRAAGLDSGNVWFSRTADIEKAYDFANLPLLTGDEQVPALFFNVTTLKDPSLRQDGLHTIEAIAIAPAAAFEAWRGSEPGRRPPEYRALKKKLEQRILDAVECFVPGLRRHLVYSTLGTPLTNTHYVGVHRGGIYGTEKTLRNLGPFGFPVRTRIEGLFHCGASTLAPGVHGVTRSGVAAACAALGCSEAELLTARSGPLRVYPSEDPGSWPMDLRPRLAPLRPELRSMA